MNAIATRAITMSSLELVDYINGQREDGEPELRHDHFMAKVPKVLGEGVAPNFRGYYTAGNGKKNPCYHLPKREACLMAMSYSYELQAKVFDRMTELEEAKSLPKPKRAQISQDMRVLTLAYREVLRVPGVKHEVAASLYLNMVEQATGVSTTPMRLALPGAKVDEAKKLNPTQLGEAIGGVKAKAVNLALQELGLQEKTERGWVVTEAGTKHGEMTPFNRHGHSGYQPLWYESAIEPLREHFAAKSNVISISGGAAA